MQLPALWLSLHNDYLVPSPDALPTLFSSGFDDGQHFLLALLFTLGVYGPLIGALAASRADGRMMQWRDWFRAPVSGWLVGQMLLISFIILGLMPWFIVLALRGIYGKDWLSRA